MSTALVEAAEDPVPRIAWWRWLRRGGLVLTTLVAVEYLALPQVIRARDDVSLLGSARPGLLVAALALEAVSLLCFSALSRVSLPAGRRPRFWTLVRIDLSGYRLSHVVPGGGATAAAFRYRLLTRAGVRAGDAVMGTTTQTAAQVVVLISVFLFGIVLSFPQAREQPSLVPALVVVGAFLLTRGRAIALSAAHRLGTWLPRLGATAIEGSLAGLGGRVELLLHDRRLLVRESLWASGNWLVDAACLWLCLTAYGFSGAVGPVLALYGAVNLVAMLPTTPGGLGVVEGVLIPSLVSLGSPASVALLGVLSWRLVQFWLPIPLAAVMYVSLRFGILRKHPRPDNHPVELPASAPARLRD
ncbi:MAG: YbhN family protein [Nocardioides sp.]